MADVTVHYDGPIVTREKALAKGLLHYFTGKPCKNGHIAQRRQSGGTCIQCFRDKRANAKLVTHERILEYLTYTPETGEFRRRTNSGRFEADSLLGTKNDNGYLIIQIDHKRYRAHHLAVFYMTKKWPKHLVDHKNLNKLDNSWSNLRNATKAQNGANCHPYKNNSSGFKGVCWCKTYKKWMAKIVVNYKTINLGGFDNKLDASLAYRTAAQQYFGEFARAD